MSRRYNPSPLPNLLLLGLGLITAFVGMFVAFFSASELIDVTFLVVGIGFITSYTALIIMSIQGSGRAIAIYLGLLVFLADISLRGGGAEGGTLDIQSLVKLMMWGGSLIIAAVRFQNIRAAIFSPKPLLLTIYALFATLSAAWSTAPAYSFGAGIALLSVVAICALAFEMLTRQQIIKVVMIALGIFVSMSVVRVSMSFTFGNTLGEFRYAGFAGSPNNLGRLGGLLILFVWLYQSHIQLPAARKAALYILGFSALFVSHSRTAMVAAGVSIWATLTRKRQFVFLLVVGMVVAIAITLIGNQLLDIDRSAESVSRSGRTSEITTFTGRTSIWAYGWKKVQDKPLIGHGYAATREFMPKEYFTMYGWTTTTLHNTILQSLATTGAIGTSLLLLIWLLQVKELIRRKSTFRDAVFMLVIVSGITEAGVVGTMPSVITILWGLSLFWQEPNEMQNFSDSHATQQYRSMTLPKGT